MHTNEIVTITAFPRYAFGRGDKVIRLHLSRVMGEKRWSQRRLAEATGIRPTTISHYYNEFADYVCLEHLDRICVALGCDASDLIEYIPNKQKRTGKDLILDTHGNRNPK